MKKILIAIFILGSIFLTFFSIETKDRLDFLEQYQTELSFSDYQLHKIVSTGTDLKNLKLTIYDCNITKDNMERYVEFGKDIARKTNEAMNSNKEYNNIQVVFKPENKKGIIINNLVSINELSYSYPTADL